MRSNDVRSIHVAFLVIVLMACPDALAAGVPEDWERCVLELDSMFVTTSVTDFSWTQEAATRCGFRRMSANASEAASLPTLQWMRNRSFTFIGDSTALRMFVYLH